MLALTHAPSPHMNRCQLTFHDRQPIDFARACYQHRAYCRMLRQEGFQVRTLCTHLRAPDAVFVEDTAIVLDEIAILTAPSAARRCELAGIERELQPLRAIRRIEPPAAIEGGDVLRIQRTLLVGLSSRTNRQGIDALTRIVHPCGYRVITVPVEHCLHLKSACTAALDGTLLVNPRWIDTSALREFELVMTPHDEPQAANLLRLGKRIWLPAGYPKTTAVIRGLGLSVETLDLSEFAKAEGSITCMSLFA